MIYLPGYQLDGIVLKGLYVFESAYEDLLQLAMSIGLEGHPGQTLVRQDNREQVHQLTTLTVLLDGHPHAPPPDFRVPQNRLHRPPRDGHGFQLLSLLTMQGGSNAQAFFHFIENNFYSSRITEK